MQVTLCKHRNCLNILPAFLALWMESCAVPLGVGSLTSNRSLLKCVFDIKFSSEKEKCPDSYFL